MTQLTALALTLAIELAIGAPLARALGPRLGWGRIVLAVVAVSLVSHPFAWAANTLWLRPLLPFAERAALIEVGVVLLETALLAVVLPLAAPRAALVAFFMNAASFGFGLVLVYTLL